MDSILNSIKKLLGITADYTHFDTDIIIYINSVFSTLTQLGVGPEKGFSIQGAEETWQDFLDDETVLESVKSCVYLRVKQQFDPPTVSSVLESMKQLASEYEWRSMVAAEYNKYIKERGITNE